ncbi:MAG: DNA polymerase III subunit delta [Phycisphaerales bacterium]|nr:DNA polymerase III subunit delta [Phycisphaerales bacterium]
MARAKAIPPIFVIFGDEEFQKIQSLEQTLNHLLPPDVDRGMALSEYDGSKSEDAGGPQIAAVLTDLRTQPFLADRRVVLIRDADKFVSAHRETLEEYCAAPSPVGTLVLECRSFLKSTRLGKAIPPAGLLESKKLKGDALIAFAMDRARALDKQLDAATATLLVERIGADQGVIANEVEKLALFVDQRPAITAHDIAELVGLTREEVIFNAVELAALGRLSEALTGWRQMLAIDKDAIYPALGGIAWKLRTLLSAHQQKTAGGNLFSIAAKSGFYNRQDELAKILARLPELRTARAIADVAQLDQQVKTGLRSIESGVEALLADLAAAR